MGSTHGYQVVAMSGDGNSVPTVSVDATVPCLHRAAHLHGVYRVRLKVRSARSIGSAFGIENPAPGKRGRDRWSFESTCTDDAGVCPSTWSGLEGRSFPEGHAGRAPWMACLPGATDANVRRRRSTWS